MKTRYFTKIAVALVAMSAMGLTSCLEEVEPSQIINQDQLDASPNAGKALIMAMPAYMSSYNAIGHTPQEVQHFDFGYPAIMRARDVQTGDFTTTPGAMVGYDHFMDFSSGSLNEASQLTQFPWQFFNKAILNCNIALRTYNKDEDTEENMGLRATARAFRAMLYLDLARTYEFLPNDKFQNPGLVGLTVPIVTEETTEEQARNNPRATHADMSAFILKDLDYAESHISSSTITGPTLPNLAAVYGLKARLYMWNEDYPNAAKYADMAIQTSGKTPLSEAAWTDPVTGFNSNQNSSWIWGMSYAKEDGAISTGIINWISFASPENQFGYAGLLVLADQCVAPTVDRSMYDRVSDTDFRKKSWLPGNPGDPRLADVNLLDPGNLAEMGFDYDTYKMVFASYLPYGGVKIRCGQGNVSDPSVAGVVDIPLMRVEEMYLIKAEAVAHTNAGEGKQLIETFMTTYRDPQYTCSVSSTDEVVEEIVFQKRVELWGEGQSFFDIKRLNYSVTRFYEGTNWPQPLVFNTQGRPAWMNWPILISEPNNNQAVVGKNNPNTAGVYGNPIPLPEEPSEGEGEGGEGE